MRPTRPTRILSNWTRLLLTVFLMTRPLSAESIDRSSYLRDCHLKFISNDGIDISFPKDGVEFANQSYMALASDAKNEIRYYFDFLSYSTFSQRILDAGVDQNKFAEAMVYVPISKIGIDENLMPPDVVNDAKTLELFGADHMVRYAALRTIYPKLKHDLFILVMSKRDVGIAIIAVEAPSFSAYAAYIRSDPTRMTRLKFD